MNAKYSAEDAKDRCEFLQPGRECALFLAMTDVDDKRCRYFRPDEPEVTRCNYLELFLMKKPKVRRSNERHVLRARQSVSGRE
ncbi:hypothetical protein FE782_03715 [Paenibacillus antri]|uniref:Uncharacterized protein n=1 Tax=Paenibacillus antri TaxID=2582848 RepID=A0A5R9GE40_9BACL|nr:hypothetical protein [Paenibacillus antri]TLS53389.1 hypothetical protein FE782_03715 [Paenibacillus antri]